jgi:hypothetical protein
MIAIGSLLDFERVGGCRRRDETALRETGGPLTSKRIAAARKRRFRSELKDVCQKLADVKSLTGALESQLTR